MSISSLTRLIQLVSLSSRLLLFLCCLFVDFYRKKTKMQNIGIICINHQLFVELGDAVLTKRADDCVCLHLLGLCIGRR